MSVSVFEHPWLGGLFAAPGIQALWSAEAQLAHLVAFERAYTEARAAAGAIPPDAAAEALAAIDAFQPDMDGLRAGMANDGVVVPALVRQLREGVTAGDAIHKGATSQDVTDTALSLTLKACTAVLRDDLSSVISALDRLEKEFGANGIMGRTRMQAALPIKAAHRISIWRAPLTGHIERLEQSAAHACKLQLGGPVGDSSSLGSTAAETAAHMAAALDLAVPDHCWHADRSAVADYSNVLALITGSLGKMGQDICLMVQQGIEDAALASGGGSSAMPHKSNPVTAELLITLAQFNAGQQALMQQAMLHEQERSGTAWALEWMVLPQMTATAGRALTAAVTLLSSISRIGSGDAVS
jgi:3-carboxy-cis,cis-muconate cycloisomerase